MKEQNRLIAEFMGYETHPNQDLAFKTSTTGNEKSTINLNTAKYSTSWDWLMPIVEKINYLDDYRYTVYIASMDTRIEDNVTGKTIVDVNCEHNPDELIQSVYKAVIEFINRYNQQNHAQ